MTWLNYLFHIHALGYVQLFFKIAKKINYCKTQDNGKRSDKKKMIGKHVLA